MPRRPPVIRYWLPFIAAAVCLAVATLTGPEIAWLLLIACFGFLVDGGTALFERAGSVGNLTTYRQ